MISQVNNEVFPLPGLSLRIFAMSLNSIRNLSSTAKRGILGLIGKVTLEDVKSLNGSKGDQWVSSVKKIRDDVETQASSARTILKPLG